MNGRAALNEAQLVHVERRLAVCPALRGTDLHAELCTDYGYRGSYATFQRQLRSLRPAVVRDPEIRFETDPGMKTQADWMRITREMDQPFRSKWISCFAVLDQPSLRAGSAASA